MPVGRVAVGDGSRGRQLVAEARESVRIELGRIVLVEVRIEVLRIVHLRLDTRLGTEVRRRVGFGLWQVGVVSEPSRVDPDAPESTAPLVGLAAADVATRGRDSATVADQAGMDASLIVAPFDQFVDCLGGLVPEVVVGLTVRNIGVGAQFLRQEIAEHAKVPRRIVVIHDGACGARGVVARGRACAGFVPGVALGGVIEAVAVLGVDLTLHFD